MGYPFSVTKEQNTKCLNELPKDELSLLQDMLNGNLFSNFTIHASYHLIWHIFTSLNEQPDSNTCITRKISISLKLACAVHYRPGIMLCYSFFSFFL